MIWFPLLLAAIAREEKSETEHTKSRTTEATQEKTSESYFRKQIKLNLVERFFLPFFVTKAKSWFSYFFLHNNSLIMGWFLYCFLLNWYISCNNATRKSSSILPLCQLTYIFAAKCKCWLSTSALTQKAFNSYENVSKTNLLPTKSTRRKRKVFCCSIFLLSRSKYWDLKWEKKEQRNEENL